jgi:hypothetical protein
MLEYFPKFLHDPGIITKQSQSDEHILPKNTLNDTLNLLLILYLLYLHLFIKICTNPTHFGKHHRILAHIALNHLKDPINILPLLHISDVLQLAHSELATGELLVFARKKQEPRGGDQRVDGVQ